MWTLALIGLVGGLITGVSPCVLPMLPIIFFAGGSGEKKSRSRVLLIIAGVVTSFSLFTLLGTALLTALGLPDDFLRWAGLTVLSLVGLGLIIPALGHLIEKPFYRLPKVTRNDGGGFLLGLGLGTLYVPCAGPVLAAITVAGATGQVGTGTVVLTVSFAIGAALPLLIFAAAGNNIAARIGAYRRKARAFRVAGGVVLIALAVGLAFNLTDVIQRNLPAYTAGIEERLAESETVQGALTPFETDENRELSKCTPGDDELASCGAAPPLRGTQKWFNTPDGGPLALEDLKGKVVLLDFFAYSCINCQRDQPYIQKWSTAYADAGLEVVGVHSPEFAFERSASNLADALAKEGTTYPVVQDNDLKTWTAYRNRYWPAKYLIDAEGTVRAIKFGEGSYSTTEKLIRELLREADPSAELPAPVTDVDEPVATRDRTPELYLSAYQSTGYAGTPRIGRTILDYELNEDQPVNTYSYGGRWEPGQESFATTDTSRLRLHFRGRNVYHVMSGTGVVTVSRSGMPDTTIEVDGTPNLYPIVEGDEVLDETLTLSYTEGIEVYTFTFG
ncbi:cytochrome c biogenesis protein CcdA [Nocardioides sp. AE5]|uniref:cytochrome c biogenesis protein CcdA n=1 Tax=Nocardioides sp. AE5 TaxID=2962573 RepID=UPI0028827CE0|nr:cytochrome c biogenesis protein CcdA [Nocardioides sp. AE5]MDT0201793.1 cytochrome c biogenesis protein CcdA [Nocardioides sp. AE5]